MTQHALTDDLPVLTDIASPAPAEELPLLTEFADETETTPLLTEIVDELADAPLLTEIADNQEATPLLTVVIEETETLPLLTEIGEDTASLPLLTEAVEDAPGEPLFVELPVLESLVHEADLPQEEVLPEDMPQVEPFFSAQPTMQEDVTAEETEFTAPHFVPEEVPVHPASSDDAPCPPVPLQPDDVAPLAQDAPPAISSAFPEPVAEESPTLEMPAYTGEEFSYLLQHIEQHLSTVFTDKLNNQLEQLQRLAVDLAVSEFKAELPQLLRDALENRKRE